MPLLLAYAFMSVLCLVLNCSAKLRLFCLLSKFYTNFFVKKTKIYFQHKYMELYFSKNLKFLRVSQRFKQAELDEIIGLGKNAMSNYEIGRSTPAYEILIKIADYFGVTIDALLRVDMSEVGIGASLPAISADKEIEYLKEALKDKEEIIYHLKKRLSE